MRDSVQAFKSQVEAWQSLPGVTLCVLDGEHCKTVADLMAHFGEAMQFPEYFAQNWDSLDECLTDLEWLPTRHVVLAICNASQVLTEDPGAREFLTEILWITGEAWAEASDEATPMSFHVILHDENEDALSEWIPELQAHGAIFEKAN